jgi:hypothetical protein
MARRAGVMVPRWTGRCLSAGRPVLAMLVALAAMVRPATASGFEISCPACQTGVRPPFPSACATLRSDRPDELLDAWRDTEHFRVHYATIGEHALPLWPDPVLLDSVSAACETAWAAFHDRLGIGLPRLDGARGGGWNLVDCYILSTPGSDGTAAVDDPDTTLPGRCPNSWAGFFRISKYALDRSRIRALVAHEYCHVVQYGIRVFGWGDESLAVWGEQQVRPGPYSQFLQASCWFRTPYLGLHSGDAQFCRMYGVFPWWLYLEETLGKSFVPDLFSRMCAGDDGAFDRVLSEAIKARGITLDSAQVGFSIWNAFTGSRDDGRHYELGRFLPDIGTQGEHQEFPVDWVLMPAPLIPRSGGSNYIRFLGPGARDSLLIELRDLPLEVHPPRVSFVVIRVSGESEVTTLRPIEGSAHFAVAGWGACREVTMIVTEESSMDPSQSYRYCARESGRAETTMILRCVPNPVHGEALFQVRPAPLHPGGTLAIFDLTGRLVSSLAVPVRLGVDPGEPAARPVLGAGALGRIGWDGRRRDGRLVPSGMYFARLDLTEGAVTTRFLVWR